MSHRDPLANPRPLVAAVYAYVGYRIGHGPDAEDVTSDVFERALRYRSSYDHRKAEPIAWLIGIARRAIADFLARPRPVSTETGLEVQAPSAEMEDAALDRIALAQAVEALSERDRDLIALRYGADLTTRQIAVLLDERPNTVDVALHRALGRLRETIPGAGRHDADAPPPDQPALGRSASEHS